IEGKDDNSTELTFTYGEFCPGKTKEEDKKSGNVFLKQDISVAATIEHHEIPLEFRQSNNSKKFIQENNGEEQEENTEPKADYISTGNILHQIFSGIKTAADVESELDRFEAEGILYGDNLDREKLQSLLNGYLTGNELVADWFSPRWTLFNECTIICEETDEKTGKKEIVARRPDRVMKDGDEVVVVDFKFGKPNEKYATQVRQYIGYLRQMGYANVRGYIWYVFRKEIKEVEK
ncbi:MAG: CRISPR-associated protein Cas4, partial [Prevotella pectinovora]